MGNLKADDMVSASEMSRTNAPLLKTVIDALPCPIYYMDSIGHYLGCNQCFADLIMGMPADRIVGKTSRELNACLPAGLIELNRNSTPNPSTGHQIMEAPVQCADGKTRHFTIHQSTYRDHRDESSGIVAIMLDMTATKDAEAALIQYRDKLEEMVAQRSAELMTINNRLTDEIEELW